jgi:5-methylcytosine-specific restriction enzyme subunit McrC
MFTDVSLERDEYTGIIETKYYREPFSTRHQTRRVRSGHLYQLYAYVKNVAHAGRAVDGVLLYAQTDQAEDAEVQLQGHRFRIVTLDLSLPWEDIHGRMTEIAEWARLRVP